MGLIENGTQGFESNVMEQSKASECLAQDPECKDITVDNDKIDCERSAAQKEVTGAQKKLVSIEERSESIKETGPYRGEIPEDVGAEKGESRLVDVKIISAFENLKASSQNGTSPENISTVPRTLLVNPGDEKLKSLQVDAKNACGHLKNEDRGSSRLSGSRKAKSKGPITSSWLLRSKCQEKPKAPEPNNNVEEATVSEEKKRRGRKKQQQHKKDNVNEFSKTKSHLKYLLHRIKYEQSLIDAYSGEGWKGQSLDKLKPEQELQRAKSHILRYKMRIRELFERLDLSFAVGKLPESLFDSQGEIDSDDIFCAKCGSKDLTVDNDIILCDGACERGFHQFCLEPPLLKEDIPPGDEGWLCPGCDCKVDCIDMLKDFQGTKISINDSWEKIFPEAASGMKVDGGSGSSPDDSEDNDYDPDKHGTAVENVDGDESSSDESKYFSAPDDLAASLNNDKYLGLPSDDSEDDDFDPSAPDQNQDQDELVNQDSSSSDFTSDSEDLGALLKDDGGLDKGLDKDREHISPSQDQPQPSTGSKEENSKLGRRKRHSLKDELSYLMEASVEPVSGKRRVEPLDYKKLNDETFGNSSSDSSDEDFDDNTSEDDTTSHKRRKIDRAKTQVKFTDQIPTVESNMNTNDENQKKSKQLPRRARKKDADEGPSGSSAKAGSSSGTGRSVPKRLAEAATQRLYASFNENQYPVRAVKENLAKELGITIQQVSKWFENARWSFNHRPRMESNSTENLPVAQPTIGKDNNHSHQSTEVKESSSVEALEDNLATNTTGEDPEKGEN
ncbi:hypothetical protein OROHE_015472 [Orobanche hederae]